MPRRIAVILTSLFALALPASAAAQDKIQPGALIQSDEGQCTMNFIYNGEGTRAGTTYVGTAAHCVSKVGQPMMDINEEVIGTVAFIADAGEIPSDYAFIKVADSQLGRVDPAMKGHPEIPTGTTTEGETSEGDLLQMSGYGIGFGETQPTQEQRQTVLMGDDAETYWFNGPSVNGDSGGPVVHIPTGKALGIISSYGFEKLSTDYGPTLEGVLAKATKAGFPVSLRLAGQSAPAAPAPQQQGTTQSTAPAPQPQTAPAQSQPRQPAQSKRGKKARKRKCKKTSRGNRGKKGSVRKCRASKKSKKSKKTRRRR